jgi:hypothetical protein
MIRQFIVAMSLMATPVWAEKPSIKYLSPAPLPSADALAKAKPVKLPRPPKMSTGRSSAAYGSAGWPFTTSRVELTGKPVLSKMYPYRTTGRLFLYYPDGGAAVCSASLVKKGVITTAAHCVAGYGAGITASGAVFYPGYFNGRGPYGGAPAVAAFVLPSYLNGTDSCAVAGIVCQNDIAVLVLNAKGGKYIGSRTGWLDVGVTGAGVTQITQLGYPMGIDYGNQMIRNDSIGQTDFNTQIGSPMDGGSSGGPWIANFGVPGTPNNVFPGYAAKPNVLVGVTSWGYVGSTEAVMGASPFNNMGVLMDAACAAYPLACAP